MFVRFYTATGVRACRITEAIALPAHFNRRSPIADGKLHSNAGVTQWLSAFAGPTLTELIQDPLNLNYDQKTATARVSSTREQARLNGVTTPYSIEKLLILRPWW
ncbi:hypothetical protein [Candidatus Methylobacter oryzae]|uniref:Uncharacterized protein n=1 Tax=Candidatus Methylobacter oryzae TaxID=2497749 RepID=A0ABY3C6F4_9GAMM|nr:hypothetical protein [Candidatus Methylobacter oryzae]TRW90628.1 hypothetical protein EKO24_018585 [Candidatus Methylobacter oryzae]